MLRYLKWASDFEDSKLTNVTSIFQKRIDQDTENGGRLVGKNKIYRRSLEN